MTDNTIYRVALELVQTIDANLERGVHYHTRSGQRIFNLDQAVQAILNDDFLPVAGAEQANPAPALKAA